MWRFDAIIILLILETYIGNIVVWKHHFRLETSIGYWKQKSDIGNMKGVWKHKSVYWKHKSVYWKHKKRLET